MNVPQEVYGYIRQRFAPDFQYLLLELKNNRVLSCEGDAQDYGFESLQSGDVLPDVLQAILDSGAQDAVCAEYPMIQTGPEQAISVYIKFLIDRQCMVIVDVSKAFRYEQSLQQKAHEVSLLLQEQERLNQQLECLNQELEEKRVETERASQAKSRFIASMSHEFRTPITSIMGFAELQQESYPDCRYPASIKRAAWHLLTLVENLLDQASMSEVAAVLNPEPVSMPSVFADMQELFEVQAADKGIALDFMLDAIPDYLLLDQLRFRQVLINLISNALRYTEAGSVTVYSVYDCGCLSLSVKDTGPGISQDDQLKIFKPFERVDRNRESGAGLGLTISRQLIQLMGGELTVQSKLGVGSEFVINLLCEEATLERVEGSELEGNVLVVEDDEDVRSLLRIILLDWGLVVKVVCSVSEARKAMSAERYDVVLSDYYLPDGTGDDLLVFSKKTYSKTSFISMSGSGRFQKVTAGKKFQPDRFLTKPVQIERLWITLSELLGWKGGSVGGVIKTSADAAC